MRTTPLTPQSDGMVERFNRTLKNMLAKFVDENLSDWDCHLPLLMMAYRSAVHETTGCSPSELMFGREDFQSTCCSAHRISTRGVRRSAIMHRYCKRRSNGCIGMQGNI